MKRGAMTCGLLLAAALMTLTATARADDCDRLVVDYAGKLKQADKVTEIAQDLSARGAIVRVRVLKGDMDGQPSIRHWVQATTAACPGWQSANGGRVSNLIVLAVVPTKGKQGIHTGSLWKPAISTQDMARILGQVTGPRFRDGNWDGGLIAGLAEMGVLINAYENRNRNGGSTTVIQEKPTDLTGLWYVLGGLLVLVSVVLSVLFLWKRKRAESLRRTSQLEAIKTCGACNSRILENGQALTQALDELQTAVGLGQASEQEASGVRSKLDELQLALNAVSGQYADMDTDGGKPHDPGLSREQYQSLNGAYDEILVKLRHNWEAIDICRSTIKKKAADG